MKRTAEPSERSVKCGINVNPHLLKVGDRVTSSFIPGERHIVRTLTKLTPSLLAEGGLASADGGDGGTPIDGVAGAWFLPVQEEDTT